MHVTNEFAFEAIAFSLTPLRSSEYPFLAMGSISIKPNGSGSRTTPENDFLGPKPQSSILTL
jgi:hypothetical protein